jgi:diguanylate cyclase (GGDEF)-like protein
VLISDIEAPVVSLGAAIALFWAAYRTRQYAPSSAKAWLLLGWAQLVFALGDITWAVLEVGFQISPYPSIADIFYILYYPMVLFAILQFPVRKFYPFDWSKRTLDFAAIMIGITAVFWNYILGPVISKSPNFPILEQILGYAYLLGDLALLLSILFLFYNRLHGKDAGPILLITIGVVILIFTDIVFSIQTLKDTYVSGGTLDSGWITQNLLVCAAGVWQIMIARNLTEEDRISETLVEIVNNLFSYYPLFWLFVSVFMLYESHFKSLPMTFQQIFLETLTIGFIVLIRQILTNIETKKLFSQIDGTLNTVNKQTQELEAANQILGFEVSERKKVEERLAFDALHDFLTKLPNRALFIDRMVMAIRRSKRHSEITYSVLFLDLDQFKLVNDTKGHSAGDQLLILVAQRLKECIRTSDTVARLGGDEFIVLLECTDNEASIFLSAKRILNEFKSPFIVGTDNVYISVSIGIVKDLASYKNSNEVLRDADIAMYHAKETGKARFEVFDPVMRTQAIQRVMIENELRYAVEYKEFKLQ